MIKELIFKYVTAKKLTKVYHRECGGHIGYIADINKLKKDHLNFYFLDGGQPKEYDRCSIQCIICKKEAHINDIVLLEQINSCNNV